MGAPPDPPARLPSWTTAPGRCLGGHGAADLEPVVYRAPSERPRGAQLTSKERDVGVIREQQQGLQAQATEAEQQQRLQQSQRLPGGETGLRQRLPVESGLGWVPPSPPGQGDRDLERAVRTEGSHRALPARLHVRPASPCPRYLCLDISCPPSEEPRMEQATATIPFQSPSCCGVNPWSSRNSGNMVAAPCSPARERGAVR